MYGLYLPIAQATGKHIEPSIAKLLHQTYTDVAAVPNDIHYKTTGSSSTPTSLVGGVHLISEKGMASFKFGSF